MTKTWRRRLIPWSVTLGSLVLWQLVCVVLKVDVFVLPAPTDVVKSLMEHPGMILKESAQTLMTTLIGFAIAVAFGLVLGLIIGASRTIYDGLYPIMISFNSIPKVAIVPVLVIWFGLGTIPAIITAFAISFFPIVVNVATGLATIEPEMRDVMRVLGARKMQILMKIGIPRAMPYFFASLKVAVTQAFVGTVIAETVASNRGIGNLMMIASSNFDVPLVFAGLMILAALGVALYVIFSFIEVRVTGWAHRKDEFATG
jgi:NitT/TauT family transport system permease protein